MEQTLLVVKPDGVQRGLVGDILSRFEKLGMKIVGMKILHVEADFVGKHYQDDPKKLVITGERTLKFWQENGRDAKEDLGSDDPVEIARIVRNWNLDFMSSGPVVAIVLESPHAIELVRKHIGHTFPLMSAPGTIRGDYHYDSPHLANLVDKRSILNLVHASGNKEEAEFEIKLWFKKSELL